MARLQKPEEILADLRRYDRTPFLRVLADVMGCPPSLQALQQFADEHPDRWTFAVATLARIGGFTEKSEVIGNVHVHIHSMSDAELRQRIQQLEADMKITDATYEELPGPARPPTPA